MDRTTASRTRLTYAKVCIEVDVKAEIPSTVKVMMRDGSITHIGVEVPWNPPKCNVCKIFGHNSKSCPRSEKLTWIPKADEIDQNVQAVNQPSTETGLVNVNNLISDTGLKIDADSVKSVDQNIAAKSVSDLMSIVIKDKDLLASISSPTVSGDVDTPGVKQGKDSINSKQDKLSISSGSAKLSSSNKYVTLASNNNEDHVSEDDFDSLEPEHVSPRKQRAAAIGVKKLLTNINPPKRKNKGKKVAKAGLALGVSSSSSSSQ